MDASAWVALGAALIALGGAWFTAKSSLAAEKQAEEVRRQTELQREVFKESQQPYVWVDIMGMKLKGRF
ncbi:hypothetical protein [Saccharomonospora viridis]|uniref:hypothetical protein n=1 Tax=Saccharomonospora viridis TaxID=1852 RepID=UPI0023F2F97E|nr:hypothetical protein [Saccharomonospora viridis]